MPIVFKYTPESNWFSETSKSENNNRTCSIACTPSNNSLGVLTSLKTKIVHTYNNQ
ncbi:hypothetical protein Scep_021761 [Stephania cephalantha]|uniref:Uncharacterized protein n=1 Tax=Stephania cephalantha TaxID=152367 RepID=A0AAP0F6Q7_9MAGN